MCVYRHTGRVQVQGLAAQSFGRQQQTHLLPKTGDLDIANSVFTVLNRKLIDRPRGSRAPMPAQVREALVACAEKRGDHSCFVRW